jgi:hypothetical protein
MSDFPIPVFLGPFLFFLFLLWPLLIIWLFDFLFGLKSNLSGMTRVLVWFSIHLLLNVLALAWKDELNQKPSLSLENIAYSLTYWCRARDSVGCIFNVDITKLTIYIFLSTIPGLFIFNMGVKKNKKLLK